MIYFVVVILVLLAIWIAVYITRRIINKNNQRKAAAARRCDPEAAVSEVGAAPTFRETAIDVTERIFGRGRGPFAESDEDAYRRRQEMYGRRSSDMAGRREGVRRAEDGDADGELPTYQESHKMPKAPAAAYDASQVHSTSQRNSAEQAMASQQPDIAPPGYSTSETPIVRRL